MTYPVFTWTPLVDPEGTFNYNIRQAQFGNGYTQTIAEGINSERQSWPLKFKGHKTQHDMEGLVNFLREKGEVYPFLWTDPTGETNLYASKGLKVAVGYGEIWSVSVTFEQRFAP